MKIKYDPQVDAAYISFKRGPTQVTTIRVTEWPAPNHCTTLKVSLVDP